MSYRKIKTWGDVAAWIASLTPEQRRQPAQIVPYVCGTEPDELHPIIAGGMTGLFFDRDEPQPRSATDNSRDRNLCVLLTDGNPYSPDGDLSYTLQDDGSLIGDQTGQVVDGRGEETDTEYHI